jgi:4-amino-4-deoxy-L-arabinose transferase-like glycosyltransferase
MRFRSVVVIVAIALAHAAAYIVHQRPDWDVSWTDQAGYQRLGEVLATTGQFTRYPDAPVFVPEVIRTPGYPAYLAVIYRLFGLGNRMAVVISQSIMFALLCVIVYATARTVTNDRVATAAGVLTALFPPLPYFGALVLTELPAAFAATVAMFVYLRAVQTGALSLYVMAGVLFSVTTLVRPVFFLLPFFVAIAVPCLVPAQRTRRALTGSAALIVAAALTMAPWFAYNYIHLGRITLSPAGGLGRGIWEVSWQGKWPGRVQAALTTAAETAADRTDREARARAIAAENGLDAAAMITYVNEWREIHDLWDSPTDPAERARARVAADQAYFDAGSAHLREDPWGYVRRAMTRSVFILWAADIPVRYTAINDLPPLVIRGIWFVQAVLMLAAVAGVIALARSSRWLEAVVLASPIVYVTAVHMPLFTEARQSLPAKPVVIVLATIGAAAVLRRDHARSHS